MWGCPSFASCGPHVWFSTGSHSSTVPRQAWGRCSWRRWRCLADWRVTRFRAARRMWWCIRAAWCGIAVGAACSRSLIWTGVRSWSDSCNIFLRSFISHINSSISFQTTRVILILLAAGGYLCRGCRNRIRLIPLRKRHLFYDLDLLYFFELSLNFLCLNSFWSSGLMRDFGLLHLLFYRSWWFRACSAYRFSFRFFLIFGFFNTCGLLWWSRLSIVVSLGCLCSFACLIDSAIFIEHNHPILHSLAIGIDHTFRGKGYVAVSCRFARCLHIGSRGVHENCWFLDDICKGFGLFSLFELLLLLVIFASAVNITILCQPDGPIFD